MKLSLRALRDALAESGMEVLPTDPGLSRLDDAIAGDTDRLTPAQREELARHEQIREMREIGGDEC